MADDLEQVAMARALAHIAHRGQVDKAGEPYIEHPTRVVGLLVNPTNKEIAVAWLHDVLEDSDMTPEDLHEAGIDGAVIASVVTLTRVSGQTPFDYYDPIRYDYIARRVKLADIKDNTNVERLARLDDATIARLVKKYAKALAMLDGRDPQAADARTEEA